MTRLDAATPHKNDKIDISHQWDQRGGKNGESIAPKSRGIVNDNIQCGGEHGQDHATGIENTLDSHRTRVFATGGVVGIGSGDAALAGFQW